MASYGSDPLCSIVIARYDNDPNPWPLVSNFSFTGTFGDTF